MLSTFVILTTPTHRRVHNQDARAMVTCSSRYISLEHSNSRLCKMRPLFSRRIYVRNGLPGSNQGLFKAEPRRCLHASGAPNHHPLSRPFC